MKRRTRVRSASSQQLHDKPEAECGTELDNDGGRMRCTQSVLLGLGRAHEQSSAGREAGLLQ